MVTKVWKSYHLSVSFVFHNFSQFLLATKSVSNSDPNEFETLACRVKNCEKLWKTIEIGKMIGFTDLKKKIMNEKKEKKAYLQLYDEICIIIT